MQCQEYTVTSTSCTGKGDNSSLSCFSKLEKPQKRKFKVPFARRKTIYEKRKEDPNRKESISSAKMANTIEQRDTMSGKSNVVLDEEKLLDS